MSERSGIEWTGPTWNPVTGCDRVSEGCDHCYALTLAKRLKAMGNPRYQCDGVPPRSGPGFGVTMHEDVLDKPLRWRRPLPIFVNSMSDLFHEDVADEFIARVFAVMSQAPRHVFQVLTKRPGRMASLLNRDLFRDEAHSRAVDLVQTRSEGHAFAWPLPNVWLGVSVENQKWAGVRIPKLIGTPAAVRFLSCEPLLGEVDLSRWIGTLDWVIAGGESGPGFRALDLDWARSLRDQCAAAGVAYFFKQVGGRTSKTGGAELDGREWRELPASTPPEIVAELRRKDR